MVPPRDADDDTIIVPRPGTPSPGGRRLAWGAAGCLAVLAAGSWAWVLWPTPARAPVTVVQAGPIVAPVAPPGIAEALAGEATILANRADGITVFQFKPNPAILVLDFASMDQQGHMLNRIAALIEKAGQPRERVLNDVELAAAIQAAGATNATYYYGHDYRISDIARFFVLADSAEVALTAEEQWLRGLLRQQAARADGARALISIPSSGAAVDLSSRAVILHHELSHGEYFSNVAYAAYAHRFWRDVLTEAERGQFRRWLASEGYDPALDDLIVNETQAYLMHTRDARFFTAQSVGISPERLAQLQALFLLNMPVGWLRDATMAPGAPATPVRAPRYRLAVVSRTRAPAARRTPRLRAASMAA